MAKQADQIIPAGKGILSGVPALGVQTATAGVFFAAGFVASEVVAGGLRASLASVERFAVKGIPQAAALRFGVGSAVTIATALVLTRGQLKNRKALAAAGRIALLMELGVAASAAREWVAMGIAKVNAVVSTKISSARAGGSFTPNYSQRPQLVGRAAGTLSAPGGTVGRFGGAGTDAIRVPTRAGGDAGFQAPSFIDPSRITQTDSGFRG